MSEKPTLGDFATEVVFTTAVFVTAGAAIYVGRKAIKQVRKVKPFRKKVTEVKP